MYCQCSSKSDASYVDEYRHLATEDIEYLGEMKIYNCSRCGLHFAHPMPPLESLDRYYKEIYRKPKSTRAKIRIYCCFSVPLSKTNEVTNEDTVSSNWFSKIRFDFP